MKLRDEHRKLLLTPLRWWWLGLVLLLVACGGNISNDKFSKGFGTIEGRLLLPDGASASKAVVHVVGLPNLKATANEKGEFSLKNVPSGKRELIVTHDRPFGRKIPVWVVNKTNIPLKNTDQKLLPTASLVGKIDARARFGGKGIQVEIQGTPFKTLTHNHNGEFRFDRVVQGCHTFVFSAPYFNTVEKKLCIGDGKKTIALPATVKLEPKRTCITGSNPCSSLANVCNQGFCVPNSGGEARIAQPELTFPTVQIGESKSADFSLLVNVGPGQLLVKRVRLKGPSKAFTLESISYPKVIKSRETFSVKINFVSHSFEEQKTLVEVETNDPANPVLQMVLKAQPLAYQSKCLKVKRFEEPPHPDRKEPVGELHFSLFNRCDRTIEIHKADLRFPGLLKARLDTGLPIALKGAHSKPFKLLFASRVAGKIKGSIQFDYHGSSEKSVLVPVEATAEIEGLAFSHYSFHFGSVPGTHSRTHWLQVRLPNRDGKPALEPFQVELLKNGDSNFELGAALKPRQDDSGRTLLYFPIRFTAKDKTPNSAWLVFRHKQLLGEAPLLVELKGSLASSTSLLSSPKVVMGRLPDCKPKYNKSLFVSNPGRSRLVIRRIALESLTPEDFQLGFKSLPIVVPPRTSLDLSKGLKLGEGFFRATAPGLRAFATLRIQVEQKGIRLPDITIPLEGSSDIPYQEDFKQAKHTQARLLVYVSSRVLDNFIRRAQLATMLSGLVQEMKKHRINLEIKALKEGENLPRPVLSSSYKPGDLTRFLESLKRTADARPTGLKWMHRYLKKVKETITVPTATLFVSYFDDSSPLPQSYYFPKLKGDAPFQVFAGVPMPGCRSIKVADRYYKSVRFYGGSRFNFCSPTTLGLRDWAKQMEAFYKGTQQTFLLRASYTLKSLPKLRVLVDGKEIPDHDGQNTVWEHKYIQKDEKTTGYHQLRFSSPKTLPPGSRLTVSYYDVCLDD